MSRRKRIFRILVAVLVILSVVGIAAFFLEKSLNEKIRNLFVKELNKQLVTEVSVKDIRFSIIRDFPYASLRFSGVTLKEAVTGRKQGILLDAGLISLRFGMLDLFKNQFKVTNMLVKDASFKMKIFEDGTDNYHFWKSRSRGGSKEFIIDLQKISLQQSDISYSDPTSGQDFRFLVKDALMKGKFSSNNYQMDASGAILIRLLETGNTLYLKDRDAQLDLSLQVDETNNRYNFMKGGLSLNDLELDITGWIDQDETPEMDLKLKSAEASLDEIVSVVPEKYQEYWKDYQFSGRGVVDISLKGRYDGTHIPAIRALLGISDGKVGRKHSMVSLDELDAEATYLAGQDQTNEKFIIGGLKARLGDGTLSGSLDMNGLKTSDINAIIKADINLSDAHELIRLDTISSLKGRLLIDGKFQGRFVNVSHPVTEDLKRCRLSGYAKVSGGELGLKGYKMPMEGVESQVNFSNNSLQVRNLNFRVGKSDFAMKGQVDNGFAWLMIKGQELDISGDLYSNLTDFDELSESSPGSGEYNFQLPADINLRKIHVNLRNFTFRKFSASSMAADLKMTNRVLTASNILMQSMKGVVSGQGSLNASSPNHSLIQCKAKFSKVNVKSLFEEFGNFGNTDLTSENLDGVIDADVVYASVMNSNLDMDLESVKAHADIRIDKGRLVNYEPMKGLSKFLRVEDLADIRFETLQNQVDIANQIIFIPNMQIRSSAIDLNLMGTHTFSNELNYHFSLALADLVSAKFKRKNPSFDRQAEFGPVEDDGRGRTMVYVSMTGTVDDPVFAYDRKAIREKLSSEMKKQKVELKEAFRKEFGGQPGDSLRKGETAREKAIRKQQEEGKFVIEWDDDKK